MVTPGAAAVPGGLITPSSMIAIQVMVSAIATALGLSLWQLNGQEPLYPLLS